MNIREITLDNEKYAMIPMGLFNKVKDIFADACGDFEDELDVRGLAAIEKGGRFYTSAEVEDMLFGANPLKKIREAEGLTQEKLAAKAGISKDYLAKIESGLRGGSTKVMKALAEALEVDVSYLI